MTIDHPHQWFGGRTYAQHGDDLVLLNIFKRLGIERPSYLDIGAHHPFDLSNTALLFARGSRGINVEANPALMEAFRLHRPLDVNILAGAAPKSGRMTLYRHDLRCGRNSFVREAMADLEITSEIIVPVMTVAEILDKYADGVCPDLLSIDIEGMDYAVLESIDFAAITPKVICVEDLPDGPDIKGLLVSRGYVPVFRAGSNLIAVRSEFSNWMD